MPAASDSTVDATQASSDVNAKVDINTLEQTDRGAFNEASSWNYNLKKLADNAATLDHRINQEYADIGFARARSNQAFFDAQMNELTYAMAELRGSRLRAAELATDRTWNPDEVAQLVAKTPVQLDVASSATLLQLLARTAPGTSSAG